VNALRGWVVRRTAMDPPSGVKVRAGVKEQRSDAFREVSESGIAFIFGVPFDKKLLST